MAAATSTPVRKEVGYDVIVAGALIGAASSTSGVVPETGWVFEVPGAADEANPKHKVNGPERRAKAIHKPKGITNSVSKTRTPWWV